VRIIFLEEVEKMGEPERAEVVETTLTAIVRTRLAIDTRRRFEELGFEKILNDAIQFRDHTHLDPWAGSDLPEKAEIIKQKYSGTKKWPLFRLAFDLTKLLEPTPQSE